jgi:hypothetical protein
MGTYDRLARTSDATSDATALEMWSYGRYMGGASGLPDKVAFPGALRTICLA